MQWENFVGKLRKTCPGDAIWRALATMSWSLPFVLLPPWGCARGKGRPGRRRELHNVSSKGAGERRQPGRTLVYRNNVTPLIILFWYCTWDLFFCNLPNLEILEKGGTTSEATASTVLFKLLSSYHFFFAFFSLLLVSSPLADSHSGMSWTSFFFMCSFANWSRNTTSLASSVSRWMMASWLRVMSSHVARSWVAGHPACLTWWPSLPMRARAPRTIFLGGGRCLKKGGISCWNSLVVGVNDVSDVGLMTDSGYSGNAEFCSKLFWWNSISNSQFISFEWLHSCAV